MKTTIKTLSLMKKQAKLFKTLLCVGLCSVMLFSLMACGDSNGVKKSDIIGEWEGTMTDTTFLAAADEPDTDTYKCTLKIKKDGTFTLEAEGHKARQGTWKLNGNKIFVEFSGYYSTGANISGSGNCYNNVNGKGLYFTIYPSLPGVYESKIYYSFTNKVA